MKNLLQHSESVDTLDELPIRSKIDKDSRRGYRGRAWRSTYPHNKVLRFLESRVGKHWNAVFSEFCHLEWLPDGHKTKKQLSWNVLFETTMKDGKVHFIQEGSGNIRPLHEHWRNTEHLFYIHPNSQILCKVPTKKEPKSEKPKTAIILGDYHQLVKVKGIWYEVKGEKKKESNVIEKDGLKYRIVPEKDLPPIHERNFAWGRGTNAKDINYFDSRYKIIDGKVVQPIQNTAKYGGRHIGPRDVMIDTRDYGDRYSFYYNSPDYNSIEVTLNRQLTSKELKRHGIKNDAQNLSSKKCPKCGAFDCIPHAVKEKLNERW